MIKTMSGLKQWLKNEIERLEVRKRPIQSLQENASLDGSILTCKKLLQVID